MIMSELKPLLQSCTILHGIGSQTLAKLNHLHIDRLHDLLFHLPFRYQDRTRITSIADLNSQQPAVIQGVITQSHWLNQRRKVYQCTIHDSSGSIHLRFFHMPAFMQQKLRPNQLIKAFGEAKLKAHGFEMIHPEIEVLNHSTPSTVQEYFTPWYPSTQGMHQSTWRKLIKQLFTDFKETIDQLEWLSEDFLKQHRLPAIGKALEILHFPTPEFRTEDLLSHFHPARQRLALEELIAYSMSNQLLKKQNQNFTAFSYPRQDELDEKLHQQLPFTLTKAQEHALKEIQQDLISTKPMLRLLQGDVGSGKTIVCAMAALPVLAKGHQVAIMAPTDLLSEQHYINFCKWLQPLGYEVLRLNRTTPTKEKKRTYEMLSLGEGQIVVGTHALFQDKVQFKNLGLVMIDEQHRFGVAQRLKLVEKANTHFHPHQLFVTATPIPRTLAMTQFSHFDLSIIKELPKGRKPIQTAVMSQDKRDAIIERLQHILQNGGQIYWVCTRIEADEQEEQLATEEIKAYLESHMPQAKIAMVHGKLKAPEKDSIMQAFKNAKYDVLVATTVIEVGVDVPNANIIIIENSERLGLSQLHQLRGRVGRGQQEAFCLLMYNNPLSETSQKRLQTIRQSTDGFWLAEQDLILRGSGDVFGTQQTGFKEFKIAKLPEQFELIKLAKLVAENTLQNTQHHLSEILDYWYGDSEKFLKA